MIKPENLVGCSVRSAAGDHGRVASVSSSGLVVEWTRRGITIESQSIDFVAATSDTQVLVLKQGWTPLSAVTSLTTEQTMSTIAQLIEDLNSLVEGKKKKEAMKVALAAKAKAKAEPASGKAKPSKAKSKVRIQHYGAKTHSPFKTRHTIGHDDGEIVFGKHKTRTVSQKTQWDCHAVSPYIQMCLQLKKGADGSVHPTGKHKKITIQRKYKKDYNANYHPWYRANH